jgi:predicted Zn-dependent protease
MDNGTENVSVPSVAGGAAIYFNGKSSRRRLVSLALDDRLVLRESPEEVAEWNYAEIRRADSPPGTLRVTCLTAPALARLEIRDAAMAAELAARCAHLDDNVPGRHGVAAIVGWSVAAAVSIVAVVLFGVPLAADRLTPLVPQAFEARLGEVADRQIKAMFDGRVCSSPSGQAALEKLVDRVRDKAGLDISVRTAVLSTPVPNAFALPGGTVYVFKGLLARAENPDEIAGVLAHEFGHLRHRDATRNLIYNGGTSFLIGLLFGDITGSGALIFASRSLVTSSYSREAEQNADSFSIDTMHRLGRSPKAMGELMLRVTGKEEDKSLSILSSHPLTEDRLARMKNEERPLTGPPLLTADEWASLKAICR